MQEENILCHCCGNIFRLTIGRNVAAVKQITCPACSGTDLRVLPSWEPLGSDISETALKWRYECQTCLRKFELPVPNSPSQEGNIHCPDCNNGHIHRLTVLGYEPLYCG